MRKLITTSEKIVNGGAGLKNAEFFLMCDQQDCGNIFTAKANVINGAEAYQKSQDVFEDEAFNKLQWGLFAYKDFCPGHTKAKLEQAARENARAEALLKKQAEGLVQIADPGDMNRATKLKDELEKGAIPGFSLVKR